MTMLFPPKKAKGKARPVQPTAWPLQAGINVVLFAGMGGACQGLEDAGFPVHVAVNHDEIAIAAHKALNPHTRHLQADIYEVDPIEATGGRMVNILWASPDCRDHSVAKGGAIVLDDLGRPVMITRPLNKTEAMRLIGNSVPKRMAMLLALANVPAAMDVRAAE